MVAEAESRPAELGREDERTATDHPERALISIRINPCTAVIRCLVIGAMIMIQGTLPHIVDHVQGLILIPFLCSGPVAVQTPGPNPKGLVGKLPPELGLWILSSPSVSSSCPDVPDDTARPGPGV